jgi:hypothetical protein
VAKVLQFGTVKAGKSKTLKLVIENRSRTADLRVTLAVPQEGGFTVGAGAGPQYLAPRGRLQVPVTFTPTSRTKFVTVIRVQSSDPQRNEQEARLIGRGR